VLATDPDASPAAVRDMLVGAASNVVTSAGAGSPTGLLFVGPAVMVPDCTGANDTNAAIPDASEIPGTPVYGGVRIDGCDRYASAVSTVEVHIVHTYRGDIRLDLVAPDGTRYRLKTEDGGDGDDDIDVTYTVNVAGEQANGLWRLRVQDRFAGDVGTLDRWRLAV
jgi:hypothetical protein